MVNLLIEELHLLSYQGLSLNHVLGIPRWSLKEGTFPIVCGSERQSVYQSGENPCETYGREQTYEPAWAGDEPKEAL